MIYGMLFNPPLWLLVFLRLFGMGASLVDQLNPEEESHDPEA